MKLTLEKTSQWQQTENFKYQWNIDIILQESGKLLSREKPKNQNWVASEKVQVVQPVETIGLFSVTFLKRLKCFDPLW